MTLTPTTSRTSAATGLSSLSSTILNVPAATIDATGIPASSTHLWVFCQFRGTSAAVTIDVALTVNNDSAANYDRQQGSFSAAAVAASEALGASNILIPNAPAASDGAGLFSTCVIWIPFYALTTANKVVTFWHNRKVGTASGNLQVLPQGGFWRNTAAISRLTFTPSAGNLDTGSAVQVFGV